VEEGQAAARAARAAALEEAQAEMETSLAAQREDVAAARAAAQSATAALHAAEAREQTEGAALRQRVEALTQREASLAEEVVRERMAKQEKAEQLRELHREMPSGEMHQQVATLREACADAKGELAALKVQLGAANPTRPQPPTPNPKSQPSP